MVQDVFLINIKQSNYEKCTLHVVNKLKNILLLHFLDRRPVELNEHEPSEIEVLLTPEQEHKQGDNSDKETIFDENVKNATGNIELDENCNPIVQTNIV